MWFVRRRRFVETLCTSPERWRFDVGFRLEPGGIIGSDCGGKEFNREAVYALLGVNIRTKDMFNLKVDLFILVNYCSIVLIIFVFLGNK